MSARRVGALLEGLEKASDSDTNRQAYRVWDASFKARMGAGDGMVVADLRACHVELLYRALVVVMARRAG